MGNFDFETGRRYISEGDLAEGIRCFLASLDLDPSHVETYVELYRAYRIAWDESGDPMVLDQMRKVAVAGLKREASPAQREILEAALDETDALILAVQSEEDP